MINLEKTFRFALTFLSVSFSGAYPQTDFPYNEKGIQALQKKNYSDAELCFKETLKKSPSNAGTIQMQFKKKSPLQNADLKFKSLKVRYHNEIIEIEHFGHTFTDRQDRCSA